MENQKVEVGLKVQSIVLLKKIFSPTQLSFLMDSK